MDGNDAGYGNSYPPAGYGTTGAYAGSGASAPVSAQGELFMQLQQMQEETARLRGMVEEQQNQIEQLKRESLERYQDLDSRLNAGAAGAPAAQQNSPADGAINAAGTPAPAQQPAASTEPGDPAKEKLYYDAAFDLIKAKDFDKASQAFGAFLRKYPSSQYAGNAQYWLGEVNLAKGDLQGAGQAFAKVSQVIRSTPRCRIPSTSSPTSSSAWAIPTRPRASSSRSSHSTRAAPPPSWRSGISSACPDPRPPSIEKPALVAGFR